MTPWLTSRRIASLGLGIVILACIMSLAMCAGGGGSSMSDLPETTTEIGPLDSIPEVEPEAEPPALVPPKLRVRAKKFMEAFYLVNGGDNVSVRRERVRSYVAPGLLRKLKFDTLSPGRTIRGTVDTEFMTVELVSGKPQARIVNVPVVLELRNRIGQLEQSTTVETSTVWSSKRTKSNPNGRWLLQSIG